MNEQPWDFGTAYQRLTAASGNQEVAALDLKHAYLAYARANEVYRIALASKILTLKAEGVAVTACEVIARGDTEVARLCRLRDEAEGAKDTMTQLAWKRNADRKDAQRFADWSQRRELAEFHGQDPEPDNAWPRSEGHGIR